MNKVATFLLILAGTAAAAEAKQATGERAAEERLSFQTSAAWSPRINLDADVAMVYDAGPDMPSMIESWRQHGYTIQVMLGVSHGGEYRNYLDGAFDGVKHSDEIQVD